MHPIKAALLVLFAPARFERASLDYALKYEAGLNDNFRDRLERGQVSQNRIVKMAGEARRQARALRRIAGEGFILCLLTITAGYLVGYGLSLTMGAPPKWALYGLQVVGASAILGASTAAGDTVEVRTFDGDSLPEQVHGAFFRGLVALGTFVFVVSVGWDSL
jgi:hypothetical protein